MKHLTLTLGLGCVLFSAGCSADVDSVFGQQANGGGAGAGSQGGAGEGGVPSSDGGSTSTNPPTTSNVDPTNTTATTNDATVTSTATGLPPQVSVDCEGGPCVVETGGACCYDLDEQSSVCEPSGECGDGVRTTIVTLQCQTPDDCSGQICCAHRELPSGSSPYESTSCVSDCNYPDLYLCDINAPDCPIYETGNGPVQSECKQSTLLPTGYYVCGFNN